MNNDFFYSTGMGVPPIPPKPGGAAAIIDEWKAKYPWFKYVGLVMPILLLILLLKAIFK